MPSPSRPSDVPLFHQGQQYDECLEHIHRVRQPRNYLEIGVRDGRTLSLARCRSVAVDPEFQLSGKWLAGRAETLLFQMTSDEFFATQDLERLLPGGIDFAFLDGMHLFEYLLRDFFNTERHARSSSIIAMHDCYPVNTQMAGRDMAAERTDSATRLWWTGDVWKVLLILRERRPDLKVMVLDCPPTGLVVVENLDPGSRVLVDAYDDIVRSYESMTLEGFGIDRFRKEFPTASSRSVCGTQGDSRAGTTEAAGGEEGDFPQIASYSDIAVMPYTALFDWADKGRYHIGGPIWPDWERTSGPRFQYHDGVKYGPVDRCPPGSEIEAVEAGDHFFWIGPISDHFGHQIRDFSTRILPSLVADPRAVLVFATFADSQTHPEALPGFFRELLEWFDVSPWRVRIINRPTLFTRLRVATQPEPAGLEGAGPPHPAYIRALTRHAEAQLGAIRKRGVTFVSRSQQPGGRFAGEAELDARFERAGCHVFHPERHSLREQLAAYASAETLVFSEGPFMHGAQLLGRSLGHVIVIKRTPGRQCGHSLFDARADRVSYVDAFSRHGYRRIGGQLVGVRPPGAAAMLASAFRHIGWWKTSAYVGARRLAAALRRRSTGALEASPNPAVAVDPLDGGQITLRWRSSRAETVEVHVGSPSGPLFSRTGPSGTATTENWVVDGMTFFLQDVTREKPLDLKNSLAVLKVRVTEPGPA